jgi:hypothetical protein
LFYRQVTYLLLHFLLLELINSTCHVVELFQFAFFGERIRLLLQLGDIALDRIVF